MDDTTSNKTRAATRTRRRPLHSLLSLFRRSPRPLGSRGERFAAAYLKKQGYKLITMNRRRGKGEIDLIVMNAEFLVFVEVRTRTSEEFMTPEASIRREKRLTLQQTVRRLLRRHKSAALRPRIDLIALIWPEGAKEPSDIRHHQAIIPIHNW